LFCLIDDAKVRQHSKQNKLFADFRQDYMRHGSLFATNSRNRPQNCRIVTAMLAVWTEIQLNRVMDDYDIPLPPLPDEVTMSLENDKRILGIGKKNIN
jgi:hypothetical protein